MGQPSESKVIPPSGIAISDPIILSYLGMINDQWRNQFYFDALKKHAANKVVLDVGTGTGLLAFYALRFGASYVYCVERGKEPAEIADRILADNFERSRFKVLNVDFWTDQIDNKIDRPIDLLVSETVGPGLFDQGMFHTWTCARPFLAENAISIPNRLHFDLWFWEHDKLPEILSTRITTKENIFFIPDAALDHNFAQSLIAIDKKTSTFRQSNTIWCNINDLTVDPYRIDTNRVAYSMDQLPLLAFSDASFPEHIIPQIEFQIDVHSPGIMSIINQISFEDNTLYLKDAQSMPWKYAPTFVLEEPGEYQFRYNNPGLSCLTPSEWLYQHKFFKE